ncbi:platelet maturation [Desmophyllum pertusum]|uniref:Platelet maturation n=1 Tax=Desmophyllum pertusum TaxID=174260 RepID=A0A9W9ZP55_9CNID|nr:platelet maturation [Desmophyllum pertusum]
MQLTNFKSGNGLLHNNNHTQRKKIVNQISAFANGSGGIILIGVEDDGTVLGQNLDSEGNSKKDVKERVELIVQGMKWSCTPESNLHWKVDFIPVQDKERCYVIAISVAGMKGGVFTKSPKSYELRPGNDGKETIHLLEFKEWKQRMLRGTNMLQNESKAMREVNEKFNAVSISDRVLRTVEGSVGKIRESFFAVGEGCPISPKGFESNLPEAAPLVTRWLQEMSSRGHNRALLVASRSLHSSINGWRHDDDDGVICDLLLFNAELGGLHLFTLCDSKTDEQFLAYSHATAKALKKALVTIGGCHEKFYITHHVIPCRARAPTEQIGQLLPDSRYPQEYDLEKPRDQLLNLLTKEQFQLVYREIDDHRELWVKGAAGSGKTLVAVEFVKELRRRHPNLEQDEILYVCENKGIRQQISNHGICRCVCRVTFMREDWPEVKHIIMDEVQGYRDEDRKWDEDNWLQKAKKVVRQHAIDDPGYLWLFIDNNQINHKYSTAIPFECQQVPAFRLKKVIRNSKRIVKFASKICLDQNAARGIEMGHDFEGEEVMHRTYQGGETFQISALKKVIKSLCTEGYSKGDITLLYGKGDVIPQNLSLELNLPIVDAESNESDNLVVSTFRKYSGLERPIVILVNVEGSLPYGSNRNAIYCCATRAMVKLIILKESQNK